VHTRLGRSHGHGDDRVSIEHEHRPVRMVAKLIMPGRDPGGFIVTALVGMGGAMVANLLGHQPVSERASR
jgi:hypothetical protein